MKIHDYEVRITRNRSEVATVTAAARSETGALLAAEALDQGGIEWELADDQGDCPTIALEAYRV